MVTVTSSVMGDYRLRLLESLSRQNSCGDARRAVAAGVVGDHAGMRLDALGLPAVFDQVLVLLAEVLQARLHWAHGPVGQRAERSAEDVVRDLVEHLEVFGAAAAGNDAFEHLTQP